MSNYECKIHLTCKEAICFFRVKETTCGGFFRTGPCVRQAFELEHEAAAAAREGGNPMNWPEKKRPKNCQDSKKTNET